MAEYPTITVGELKAALAIYPDDHKIDFGGLRFSRLKQRGPKHVQCEFSQLVYLDQSGRVAVDNLE